MSMTISTARFRGDFQWNAQQPYSTGVTDANLSSALNSFFYSFEEGTGSGQVNLLHEVVFYIATGGTQVFDLWSFTEMATATTTGFQAIKFMVVSLEANDSEITASSVVASKDASNGWQGFWSTGDGKQSVYANFPYVTGNAGTGVPVTNTNRNLLITNADGTNIAFVRLFLAGIRKP